MGDETEKVTGRSFTYIQKRKICTSNNQTLQIKQLEKNKLSRKLAERRKIKKIRTEISKTEKK